MYINIENMFGGKTTPAEFEQKTDTELYSVPELGENDLEKAGAVIMTWIIAQSRLGDDVNENMYAGFEDNLIKNFEKW